MPGCWRADRNDTAARTSLRMGREAKDRVPAGRPEESSRWSGADAAFGPNGLVSPSTLAGCSPTRFSSAIHHQLRRTPATPSSAYNRLTLVQRESVGADQRPDGLAEVTVTRRGIVVRLGIGPQFTMDLAHSSVESPAVVQPFGLVPSDGSNG